MESDFVILARVIDKWELAPKCIHCGNVSIVAAEEQRVVFACNQCGWREPVENYDIDVKHHLKTLSLFSHVE